MRRTRKSGACRSTTVFDTGRRHPRETDSRRGARPRIEVLRNKLTPDGWMWTEKLRRWDRGQREQLSELIRGELVSAKKNRQTARFGLLEQVLLALEYVETTDRSSHGYTAYRGGIWEVRSGGLPGLGKRA